MTLFDETKPLVEVAAPLADWLVVRVFKEAEKTEGGIIRPEGARRKEVFAKVAAVGPLVDRALTVIHADRETVMESDDDLDADHGLLVGDWVVVSGYAGYTINWDDKEHRVVRASDVYMRMLTQPQGEPTDG